MNQSRDIAICKQSENIKQQYTINFFVKLNKSATEIFDSFNQSLYYGRTISLTNDQNEKLW